MHRSALAPGLTGAILVVGCSSPHPTTHDPGVAVVDKACSPQACHADAAAARAALEQGDFAVAQAAYACADTREAAFGAGLSTLITAVEGASATQVLADLGLPRLPAADLFGPTGMFARYAARWRGSASLQMTDSQGAVRPVIFERGQQLIGSGTYVRLRSATSVGTMSIQLGATPFAAGTTIQLGCQTGFAPYLSISTDDLLCNSPAVCAADGGTIVVAAAGAAPGDKSEYQLHQVKLSCHPRYVSGAATAATFDGTVTTILATSVDVSDLHPLISDDQPFASIPAATTFGQLAADAAGLRDSLDAAACYFKTAANGPAGTIYEIPGSVFGAAPIPATAADAKLLAGSVEALAAALDVATAYDLPMAVGGILCGGSIGCLSGQALVDRLDSGLGRLISPDPIGRARARFLDASALGAQAFAELSAESIILRTPATAVALDRARDDVQWAHDSLNGQNPNFPHTTPPLAIDLASPLAHPPDPSQIPAKPLFYDATSGDAKIVDAFMRAAFPAWRQLQWTGAFWRQFDVESLPTPDGSELMTRRIEGYGIFGN